MRTAERSRTEAAGRRRAGRRARSLAALLLAVLLLLVFSGCAANDPQRNPSETPAVSTEETAAAETTSEAAKETEPLFVSVPSVIGEEAEAARKMLAAAGLGDPIISREYSDGVPRGRVVSQNVEGGTVLGRGSVITLTVSRGPEPFTLPDMSGWEAAAAKALLDARGIAVSLTYVNDKEVAADVVLGQDLPQGTVLYRGDTVRLTVSEGEALIELTDTVGLTQAEAEALLSARGFTVTILTDYDGRVPAGRVIAQTPTAGESFPEGTAVTLSVSKGPAPTQPAPTTQAPTKPAPTTPAPTQPAPTTPAETQPDPTEKPYVSYHFRSSRLLNEHYEKHGREMGFKSAADYEKAASDVINNPNALSKREKEDNDWVFYIVETNEFVVLSVDGYIRTYFLPNAGKAYYDRQ